VLRTRHFTELWVGVHSAWGGAFYGNVARNFLRYGWDTALAPVVSSGIVDPAQFEFYYHHPPGVMWLTALSFLVFGVHEWSARLAPLVFSLLTMVLVFRFASAFGRTAALCALAIFAVLPVETYYATHLDPNGSMSIFFTALAVDSYRRGLTSDRPRDWAFCAGAIVLGCLTGWFTYLIVPGIVLHHWATRGLRPRLWLLPVCAVAVFALFLAHRELALTTGRPEVYDALGDRLVKRTVDFGAGRAAIMATYARFFWTLYTPPVVALTVAWAGLFVSDLRKKQLQAADWCLAILFSYGLLYALAFPGHLPGHDFFVRTYAPAVAIAGGVVLSRAAKRLRSQATLRSQETLRGHAAQCIALGVVLAAIGVVATVKTRALYWADDRSNGFLMQGIGEAVGQLTTLRDPVLLPIRDDRVLQYYVDRPVTFGLDTPAKIASATATATRPYLIAVPERNAGEFPEVLAYLEARYPLQRTSGVLLFQGRGPDRLR
jgi:4-amino-4-deoxy-L-arabinose transferase-like glycosyltransferase